jgi:hypothetical protein
MVSFHVSIATGAQTAGAAWRRTCISCICSEMSATRTSRLFVLTFSSSVTCGFAARYRRIASYSMLVARVCGFITSPGRAGALGSFVSSVTCGVGGVNAHGCDCRGVLLHLQRPFHHSIHKISQSLRQRHRIDIFLTRGRFCCRGFHRSVTVEQRIAHALPGADGHTRGACPISRRRVLSINVFLGFNASFAIASEM